MAPLDAAGLSAIAGVLRKRLHVVRESLHASEASKRRSAGRPGGGSAPDGSGRRSPCFGRCSVSALSSQPAAGSTLAEGVLNQVEELPVPRPAGEVPVVAKHGETGADVARRAGEWAARMAVEEAIQLGALMANALLVDERTGP